MSVSGGWPSGKVTFWYWSAGWRWLSVMALWLKMAFCWGLLVESGLLLFLLVSPKDHLPLRTTSPERTWDQTGREIKNPPCEQTNRCKNITFSQLCWRAVIRIAGCVVCTVRERHEQVEGNEKANTSLDLLYELVMRVRMIHVYSDSDSQMNTSLYSWPR